jgi:MFS family permease
MYYLMDHLHLSAAAAASAVAVSTLIMTVVSIAGGLFGGWASDRTGRRKPFVAASAIIAAAGLALIALAQNTGLFYLAMAVFGLGLGLYLAVDVALAVAVLPDTEHAAKDLGVLNIANALPQSLVPIIAPLFLGIASTTASNYAALFLFGTVCALLGALAIQFVRRVR